MLIIIIVFCGVFAVTALMIAASGMGASEQVKRNMARLEALIVAERTGADEAIDVEKKELLSSIPLLNRILLRLELTPRLRRLLYQADLKWTPGAFVLVTAALWVISSYLAYLRTGVGFFAVLAGAIPASLPLIYAVRKRRKRFLAFEEELPAALDLMVNGLRGGHSLVSVLGMAAREMQPPIGPELRICFDEQNYGLDMRVAMENLATRVPIQDVRFLMTAVLVQRETGGNLAEILERCAALIRERFRLKREIRVKTAQGRMTGWILSLLPLGLGGLLFLIKPEVISLLWKRPLGVKMLYAGGVLVSAGAILIRRIVNIRV